MTLSGGMKRRVMIAKALSHEPQILFLDEPTAGVDVELRRTCGRWCARCATSGVTIILTTHYIEEAEEMADRVGVINKGELILVEDKAELMHKLGKKQLTLQLQEPLDAFPPASPRYELELSADGTRTDLHLRHPARAHRHRRPARRPAVAPASRFKDLQTTQSSLEDIFVSLVRATNMNHPRRPRDLRLRDGAHLAHAAAEHRLAGASRPRSISWCSARPSARASPRSTASATAPSSCRA